MKDIGFRRANGRDYLLAYAIPAMTAILILAILLTTRLGSFELSPTLISESGGVGKALTVAIVAAPTAGAALNFVPGLAEEIGWRGFLHARLIVARVPHPFVVTGLIWSVWHWPLILFSDYASSRVPALSLGLFTVTLTSMSVFVGWLRQRSGSVFVAALAHGTHNLWILYIYPAFLRKGPLDAFMGGEAGLLNATIYLIVAGFIYVKWLRHGTP